MIIFFQTATTEVSVFKKEDINTRIIESLKELHLPTIRQTYKDHTRKSGRRVFELRGISLGAPGSGNRGKNTKKNRKASEGIQTAIRKDNG